MAKLDLFASGGGWDRGCLYDLAEKVPVIGITDYDTLTPNSQEEVMAHLVEVGHLSVAVESLMVVRSL